MKNEIRYLLKLVIIVGLEISVSLSLSYQGIGRENILMVYIVGVLLVATFTRGYFYGITASLISVLCFNYLFITPYYDFHISDSNDYMLMLFFLMTSFIACSLTDRFQKQIIISQRKESISKQLYNLSERLLNVSGIDHILNQGKQYIEESLQCQVIVSLQVKEIQDHIFSITGMNRLLGSVEVLTDEKLTDDQILFVKAASNQIGNALEREMTYLEQEKIKVEMEREHMLNSMLKSISHDLRTPLTGIVGASQLIMEQSDLSVEDKTALAKDIHDQANWLTQIIENILNMSKIDSGSLYIEKNLEVIDDLIYEAIQHVPELENRQCHIHIPQKLLLVNVDGKLMIQVLINILNNAVKYTTPHDQICILVEEDQENIILKIRDSGVGIHESVLEHIFDEFVTYSGVNKDSQKGIGLGLAICKSIMETHGGKISAYNNAEKGACFVLTFPKEKEYDMHDE